MLDRHLVEGVLSSVLKFVDWLDKYGETSYDYQSFFASPSGNRAKNLYYKHPALGTIVVSPRILCEAILPSARRFFWRKERFPIADAHYAMGYSFLYLVTRDENYYRKALHFLDVLERTKSPSYANYCWGYPFNWQTKNGIVAAGTPLITTTPYGYEAFLQIHDIDKNETWLPILRSIADHTHRDIKDVEISENVSTCTYSPDGVTHVVNASAYRSFLLTSASVLFSEERYWKAAERNLNFVLQSQQADGSWLYSVDGKNEFIDHFHTCFVLKALAKIEGLTGHEGCRKAIEKGVAYYKENLLNAQGLPKPFARAPRFTIYRQELYDYAECINLAVLLRSRFGEFDTILTTVITDLLQRWQLEQGSFRSRRLYFGWDEVPMHRWAQSQTFRSLCFFLNNANDGKQGDMGVRLR